MKKSISTKYSKASMTRAEITTFGLPCEEYEKCAKKRNTKELVTFSGRRKDN